MFYAPISNCQCLCNVFVIMLSIVFHVSSPADFMPNQNNTTMGIGARCMIRPGLALLECLIRLPGNIELGLFKHKERARVSALRFSWALIEQRKRNNPLCATGLVRLLHSALSWLAVLGAV